MQTEQEMQTACERGVITHFILFIHSSFRVCWIYCAFALLVSKDNQQLGSQLVSCRLTLQSPVVLNLFDAQAKFCHCVMAPKKNRKTGEAGGRAVAHTRAFSFPRTTNTSNLSCHVRTDKKCLTRRLVEATTYRY